MMGGCESELSGVCVLERERERESEFVCVCKKRKAIINAVARKVRGIVHTPHSVREYIFCLLL